MITKRDTFIDEGILISLSPMNLLGKMMLFSKIWRQGIRKKSRYAPRKQRNTAMESGYAPGLSSNQLRPRKLAERSSGTFQKK